MKTFVHDSSSVYDWIEKGPGDKKDYSNDWADWLAQSSGDTIAASAWTVQTGLTKESTPPETFQASGLCTVWLSGGVLGTTYLVTNTITTAGGRIKADSFEVRIRAQ